MTERPSVLVVSKPYQVLMGLSALHREARRAHLFVMDAGFRQSEAFLALLEGHPAMELVIDAHTIPDYETLRDHRHLIAGADLFVEDDRVSLYRLFRSLKPRTLSVVEEGIGTYSSHYWSRASDIAGRLKAAKWAVVSTLTGCGMKIGGGRKTRHVYCARPELFAKLNPDIAHKARRIEGLALFRDHFARLVADRLEPLPGSQAVMALLGWHSPSKETLAKWLDHEGPLYFKPHPHRPELAEVLNTGQLLPDLIPAEYLIDFLDHAHDRLDIYHSASSACVFYPFEGSSGLRFHSTVERWYTARLASAMASL